MKAVEDDPALWRVLAGGFDNVDLWELPGTYTFHSFPQVPERSADVSVAEVQSALTDALQRGLIVLHEGDRDSELALAEATTIVSDRRFFDREATPRTVYVVLTDAGVAASEDAWRGNQGSGGST
jgi:hypothetical protein